MKERIEIIIKELHLTKKEFAQALGVSQSAIGDFLNGRLKSISTDVVANIYKVFNVNPTWILTGEGEMFTSHPVPLSPGRGGEKTPPDEAPAKVVQSDAGSGKKNGHLTGIDGNVETYPDIKEVEQVSRTKWFENYSSDKKTIVAANDELLDGEALHELAEHMVYLVKMQRAKLERLKQDSDKKSLSQKGEAG